MKTLAAVCRFCTKPVSKEGNVHTSCRNRQEFLDNIDDIPAESPLCSPVDYHGNETE
jgi:hypothetical protein